MKKGDKTKIAKFTGLSKDTISRFFNHPNTVKNKIKEKIWEAIKELKIDYQCPFENKLYVAKHTNPDRWDIYNNLPHGAMAKIARKVGCNRSHIKFVLEGKRTDHQGIIKEAELLAAIHIWKTRFCKFKSRL